MIDFEREIEIRLDRFQSLTNRGNVKDSNYALYEIVRLMLGMITQRDQQQRHPFNMHQHTPELDAPIRGALHQTSEATPPATLLDPVKDAVNDALADPAQTDDKDHPRRPVHAPYGFTAAGNVRRKRS